MQLFDNNASIGGNSSEFNQSNMYSGTGLKSSKFLNFYKFFPLLESALLCVLSFISLAMPVMTYFGYNVTGSGFENIFFVKVNDALSYACKGILVCALFSLVITVYRLGKIKSSPYGFVGKFRSKISVLILTVLLIVCALIGISVSSEWYSTIGIGLVLCFIGSVAGFAMFVFRCIADRAVKKNTEGMMAQFADHDVKKNRLIQFLFLWLSVMSVFAILLCCVLPYFFVTPFDADKCDSLSYKTEVVSIFGVPDDGGDTDTYTYYSSNYKNINIIVEKIEEAVDEELMNSDIDADTDLEDMDQMLEKYEKIDEIIEKLEEKQKQENYKYTKFFFNDEGKITSLYCDASAKYPDVKKTLAVVTVKKGYIKKNTNQAELTYFAKYTDDSFIKQTIRATAEKFVSSEEDLPVKVTFSDMFGEYTVDIESIESNNVVGYIDGDTLYITSDEGEMPDGDYSSVKKIVVKEGVTKLRSEVWNKCIDWEELSLPDSIRSVDANGVRKTAYYKNAANWKDGFLIADGCVLAVDLSGKTDIVLPETAVGIAGGIIKSGNFGNLTLNKGLKYISDGFISNCKFSKISIPSGIEFIGYNYNFTTKDLKFEKAEDMFFIDYNMEGIIGKADNVYIGDVLQSVLTVPESVTTLKSYVFEGWDGGIDLSCAVNLKEIEEMAFRRYDLSKGFTVPASVEKVNVLAFYESGLQNLNVEEGSATYSAEDGVLFSKDKKTLVYYPDNKSAYSYTVPDYVTTISEKAFHNVALLKELTVNKNVIYVKDDAFPYISSVKVYCEEKELPETWDDVPYLVIWDYKNNVYDEEGNAYYTDGNGIKYRLGANGATVVVQSQAFAEINIPETVAFDGKTYVVNTIEEGAFNASVDVTSITLPFVGQSNYITDDNYNEFHNGGTLVSILKGEDGKLPSSLKKITVTGGYLCHSAFAGCENVEYVHLAEDVKEIGIYAFNNCNSLREVIIDAQIDNISLCCFANCISLENLILPDSIVSIDKEAFIDSGISSLKIPDKVLQIKENAFYNCTSLTEIVIPDSVQNIGDRAFKGCTSLVSVNIPSGVKTINEEVFTGCSSLRSVEGLSGVTEIKSYAFENCSSLLSFDCSAAGLKYIGGNAFKGCVSLKSFKMPNSVTKIDSQAFADCTMLNNTELSQQLKSIERGAFMNCTSITEMVLPEGVETIMNEAFSGCKNLKKLVISDSVTYVGNNILFDCGKLEELTVPFVGREIDSYVNNGLRVTGYYFGREEYEGSMPVAQAEDFGVTSKFFQVPISLDKITVNGGHLTMGAIGELNITELTIGKNVTAIDVNAINNCENLEKINIEDIESWVNIDFSSENANGLKVSDKATLYYNGEPLTNLEFSDNVTEIKPFVFANCLTLKTVKIGAQITKIGERAFDNCNNLNSAVFDVTSGWKYNDTREIDHRILEDKKSAADSLKNYDYGAFTWTRV